MNKKALINIRQELASKKLIVQVIVRLLLKAGAGRVAGGRGGRVGVALFGEAEVAAEAARLLESLRKHLVLADVVVADRAARELHRLLEVVPPHFGHWVAVVDHCVRILLDRKSVV